MVGIAQSRSFGAVSSIAMLGSRSVHIGFSSASSPVVSAAQLSPSLATLAPYHSIRLGHPRWLGLRFAPPADQVRSSSRFALLGPAPVVGGTPEICPVSRWEFSAGRGLQMFAGACAGPPLLRCRGASTRSYSSGTTLLRSRSRRGGGHPVPPPNFVPAAASDGRPHLGHRGRLRVEGCSLAACPPRRRTGTTAVVWLPNVFSSTAATWVALCQSTLCSVCRRKPRRGLTDAAGGLQQRTPMPCPPQVTGAFPGGSPDLATGYLVAPGQEGVGCAGAVRRSVPTPTGAGRVTGCLTPRR